MPALYAELHRIAEACLAGERLDHPLQRLRLLGQRHVDWSCLPRILGNARKRGGGFRVPLDDLAPTRLEEIDERQARIVELRFFSGLSVEDTAAALAISPVTVKREWRSARLWLVRELDGARP